MSFIVVLMPLFYVVLMTNKAGQPLYVVGAKIRLKIYIFEPVFF